MKANMKRFFSITDSEIEQVKIKHEKIELVDCPLKEMMCNAHLLTIKKCCLEAELLRKEKEFSSAIDKLKIAFYKSSELINHPCTRCVHNYRSIIIDSLDNIHEELEKITSGIFGNKRFQLGYLKSLEVLEEFKILKLSYNFDLNESKDWFLGNNLN